MAAPANPHEGQVAIPWSRPDSGHVVGVLGARAIRWVEEATGKGLDQIYMGFARSMEAGSMAGLRIGDAAAIVWAAIEHHRRRTAGPGPEYSIDDADEICDEVGRDRFYQLAFALMYWSASGKDRRDQERAMAEETGKVEEYEAGLGELVALAAGTGTPTSGPASEQGSPSTTSGD